ncbi:MAG TPA: lanthionine synthetase LanC family protein, partial [Micromonosporaceae bacterium]
VDHALMSIHARGIRYADLHPANLLIRPDGQVVLVDFEIATELDDERPIAMAAPGFAAPPGLSGRAADAYVMNCLRQWVFLPISPLTDRDPAKLASLTRVITDHFPVPASFGPRMIGQFSAGRSLGEDQFVEMFAQPDWPTIRDSLVAGVLQSATPDREDRLFPGDPALYASGGFTVAHGAAGVLWALHQVGATVADEHVDWLTAAARRASQPRPGLLDGLHGVALVQEVLGRRDDALATLERACEFHDGMVIPGIHSGLAGAGLSLLHFAELTGADPLRAQAVELGHRLAAQLDDSQSPLSAADRNLGLQHGLTGVALYFLRLHDTTGEPRYLDLAHQALQREIEHGQFLPDGTFQLLEANRYVAYLGTGSIGLALALSQYQQRRPEPAFDAVIDGARRACRAPFVRHPFLFMGRAGTIAALHQLGHPDDRALVGDHIRRLGWHALPFRGHLAFPGNQLLRLSMDLATGAAGVLVALGVAFNQNASVIPHLDLRSAMVEGSGRR